MDLVMAAYGRLAGVDVSARAWAKAEAVQYAAAVKRWPPERIAELLERLWSDPFNQRQTLAALLTPSRLELGERIAAPARLPPNEPTAPRPGYYVRPPPVPEEERRKALEFLRTNGPKFGDVA